MKKGILLILLIFGVFALGFGQINDRIKNESNRNTNNRSNTNTGNSGNSGNSGTNFGDGGGGDGCGGCASGCLSGCASLGCGMMLNGMFRGFWQYNRRIMDKKPEVPRVISLDVMVHGGLGLNTNNTYVVMARVRGNLGFFSTDFRFFNRYENGVGFIDSWKTLEWQILQLNLVQGKYANLRIGSGIYVQNFDNRVFNEHTLGLSLYAPSLGGAGDFEYRIVPDYNTGQLPRQEVNMAFRKRFIDFDHLHVYGTVGGMYQNFYRGVIAWSGFAGVHINLH